MANKHPNLSNKMRLMDTRQEHDETVIGFVARLHELANIGDPLTECTMVDGTQDILHMEPFILLALVKGLYDEDTKSEVLSKDTVAFVEEREIDRQDAQSLGGGPSPGRVDTVLMRQRRPQWLCKRL